MAATKVLVVDDDLNIQRVLVFTLKQEGYEVHVASDGAGRRRDGGERRAGPHPHGRRDAEAGRLRGDAADPRGRGAGTHVPIIMLTAEADVEQRVRGLRAGADDDIVKPFHPLELIARIKALLARSGRGQAAEARAPRRSPSDASAASTARRAASGTTTLAINTAIALATRAQAQRGR